MSPRIKATLRTVEPQAGLQDEYVLADSVTIGRHPTNKMVVGMDSVSRFHARIDRKGDTFVIQDLNSSNGTFINSERITQAPLQHEDRVTFGAIEFVFLSETLASAVRPPEPERDVIEIHDDREEASQPVAEKVLSSQEIQERSSVFTSRPDETADRATLMHLNRRLTTLYELAELLRECGVLEDDVILQRALDLVFNAVDADRGVILARYSRESAELEVAAVKYRDEPIHPSRVSLSRSILDRVVNDKVSVLSANTAEDERFESSESIIVNQIRSALCVPMIQQQRVMGVIHLDSTTTERLFTQDDLAFISMIAGEIGVALENARMRREAVHRERLAAVGETVAGISHNAKNILLLMQGGSELLDRAINKEDVKGTREAWGVVQRGIDKIARLVQDMLAYSSNKTPELTSVDINQLVLTIAEDVEEQLIKSGITLELSLEEDPGARPLDEGGLQRTLMNLVVNALEAIDHPEGKITITTTVLDDEASTLVITVSDNGPGIPPELIDRIFIPFYTTKGSNGTGLGLPMCRKVIEDMGGSLTVQSEEQLGTEFIIQIPLESKGQRTSDEE